MLRLVNRQRRDRVPVAWLSRVADCAARRLKVALRGELVVTFIDHRTMQRLNWRFLRHRGVTDVLTFRYSHPQRGPGQARGHQSGILAGFRPAGLHEPLDGDILITPAVARRYARQHGLEYREELARYVVHGLLHWVGHDDATPLQQRRMRAVEDQLLACCGVRS